MSQLYAEAGVKRKDTAATMGLRLLMILGIVIGFLILLLGQMFGVVGVVLIVALFYLYPKLNVDYEYVFVDGQIDFDRITGKSKRKTLLRIDLDQVEIIAPASSRELDAFTYVKLEVKNFASGDKDSKPYVIIANVDSKKTKITFEPSEKMVSMIRQKSPRKLVMY
ncbi:MAG TPA: DUF6106 family protein [Mobilitalea sp.]|nr:DUF6106 family protein [Mobilitalea sp.]